MKILLWAAGGMIYTLVATPICIFFFRSFQILQKVRADGPPSHKAKSRTPTMGGIVFLLPILFWLGYEWRIGNAEGSLLALSSLLGFCLGLIDDELKHWRGTLGLPARYRLALYLTVGALLGVVRYISGASVIGLPFFSRTIFLDYRIIYLVSLYFGLLVAGVNFSDGLDGLLCGMYVLILPAFAVLFSPDTLKAGIWLMFGMCCGFLWFNTHPAQIFLGEVGSQTLAFFLATAVVLSSAEIPFTVMGLIFFLEVFSVMLQVVFFRLTGRRIFRMSPLHHHFELSGWQEPKVVLRFWLATILLCIFTGILWQGGWL